MKERSAVQKSLLGPAFSGGGKHVKKLCSNARDVGLTLVGGLRSPCHRATKPAHPRACTLHLEMPASHSKECHSEDPVQPE